MSLYLDTSAAMKLLVEEAESAALAQALDALDAADHLVSSWLLHAELHCAAARRPDAVHLDTVTAVLDRVVLIDLVRADFIQAPSIGSGLRSQDALHLAVALRVGADEIVTYDQEQANSAVTAGLGVIAPH